MSDRLLVNLFLSGMVSLLMIVIGSNVYRQCHLRWFFPEVACIVSGPHSGRKGAIVSDWPFDLRVTVNTEATDVEKKTWAENKRIELQDPSAEDWILETAENLRSWPTVWRWQAEWISEEPKR